MLHLFLKKFISASRKSNPRSTTCQRLGRSRLRVELLESRDLPAPLTFFAGPDLPAARGGAVAAADQGSAFTLLGGGPSNVLTVNPADPAWSGTSGAAVPFEDQTSVGPGIGILGPASLLVFGGDQGGAVADAYLYYPATGSQPVASMHTPRELMGYATDQQANVYAIGGIDDNGTPLASMEYYTQSTNTWTFTAPLPQTLYAESASYDGNGHIFTFGGVGANGTILNTVYEYTIATNSWSVATAMPVAVRDSAAVLASNNLIYVLGGKTSSGTTAAVESYNPATNTWNTESSLPNPVSNAAVVSDSLGRIEILGGFDASGNALANVWVSQRLNAPDSAPSITSTPLTGGRTGIKYSYQVLSTANPQATYALTTAPTGMTVDPNTGLIQWTPTGAQTGNFSVTVVASNYAGQTSQSFTINVTQSPPSVPTGIYQSGETVDSATLSWNPSTGPLGVDHYNIYHYYGTGHSGRGGGITYHYDLIGTSTTPTFTITGLTSGGTFSWYTITAVDPNGLSSGYSTLYTIHTLPDTVPPVLTLPPNQTVIATSLSGATDPGAFAATATDPGPGIDRISIVYAVPINGSLTQIPTSYVFPIGTTTVTAIAEDMYGNYVSGSFTVTVEAYVVTSTADDGSAGTLRDAINQVNAGNFKVIDFSISGTGVQTINLTSQLPTLTASGVSINGSSQGGSGNTKRLIELNGSGAGSGRDGLLLQGSNDIVSGLIIENFSGNGIEVEGSNTTIGGTTAGAGNIISGNTNDGVLLDSTASGVSVQGNYIGVNVGGNTALANGSNGVEVQGTGNSIGGSSGSRNLISGNIKDGIKIDSGGSGNLVLGNAIGVNTYDSAVLGNSGNGIEVAGNSNTIGASYAVAPNEISGNTSDGVLLDSSSSGNVVLGNYIGTNHAGLIAMANKVGIEDAGSSNTLGGSVLGARNVISGNSGDGVLLDSTARAETIAGNYIGVNVGGNTALANGSNGVEVQGTANIIGGNSVANYYARNFISGNKSDGVLLDSGSSGNQLLGNFIGVGVSGTNGVGNVANAIEIAGSSNTIGGTLAGYRNVVSGSGNDGVLIDITGVNNLLQGNFVGTDYTGKNPVANSGNGIEIAGNKNVVGGTASGAGNVISGNSKSGVLVSGSSGDTVSRNSIFANVGLGISLASGANNNRVAPSLSSATISGSTLTVQGSFTAATANVSYVLEFFANVSNDPEGKIYLGSLTVTPKSTGTQNFTFTTTTTVTGTYPLITATLTDNTGDTSSYSNGVTAS